MLIVELHRNLFLATVTFTRHSHIHHLDFLKVSIYVYSLSRPGTRDLKRKVFYQRLAALVTAEVLHKITSFTQRGQMPEHLKRKQRQIKTFHNR